MQYELRSQSRGAHNPLHGVGLDALTMSPAITTIARTVPASPSLTTAGRSLSSPFQPMASTQGAHTKVSSSPFTTHQATASASKSPVQGGGFKGLVSSPGDLSGIGSGDLAGYEQLALRLGLKGSEAAQFVLMQVEAASEREDRRLERREREKKEERERADRAAEREHDMRVLQMQMERMEREAERRERETERKIEAEKEARREQMEAEKRDRIDEVQLRREEVKTLSEASTASQVRLPQFDGREDIDTFLQHFERVASLAGWAKQGWIKRLAPLLQGGAREVYIRLPEQEAKDYELVKKALLSRFRRNAEYYRKQFRTVKKDAAESFTEFVKRLRSLLSRWFCMADADEKDAAVVINLFVQEQLMDTLNADLEMHVRDHKPSTPEETAEIADRRSQAKWDSKRSREQRPGMSEPAEPAAVDKPAETSRPEVRLCYGCHQKGHVLRNCPQATRGNRVHMIRAQQGSSSEPARLCKNCASKPVVPEVKARVNGQRVIALRDTGADLVVVSRALVKDSDFLGRTQRLSLADPTKTITCPMAMIDVESPFLNGRVEAAVADSLGHGLVIGNDVTYADGVRAQVPVYATKRSSRARKTCAQVSRVKDEKGTNKFSVPKTLRTGVLRLAGMGCKRTYWRDEDFG